MYLKRKADAFLQEWKESPAHLPLIIRGPRQVGKTETIRHFSQANYKNIVEINFVEKPQFKRVVDEGFAAESIIRLISRMDPSLHFEPGETLIFFDEILEFPEITTSLKFFKTDGRFDVICSGSLLGIQRKRIESHSVGYKTDYFMRSFDFEEFLWAVGNETMMDAIRMNYGRKHPMGPLHRKAMELLRQYMIVGGMPQAVLAFVETKSFERTDRMKRDILALYKADIAKYATGQETHVSGIFDQIPSQLQRHERRFKLSSVSKGGRMRDFQNSFFWLSEAMTVNIAYNTTEPNVGLGMNVERSSLKCYLADTGLLLSMAFDENTIVSEELYRKLLLDKLEVNAGMLLENLVAQMLRAAGHKLYFYSNNSREEASDRMEVDFLISKSAITSRHNISPIEVKSGRRYAITSLNKMMDKYSNYLSTSYVIHTADYAEKDTITYLPVYMVPLL